MMYDEFGNKDYSGYLLLILFIGYIIFISLAGVGWLVVLTNYLS